MSQESPLFQYGEKPYADRQAVHQLTRSLLMTLEAEDTGARFMAALESLSASQRYAVYVAVRNANEFFDGPVR